MTFVERYLFRQLLVPIAWAIAALTAVAMLSQSLSTLDVIVERGQSAWVLVKVTLFALPRLLSMIIPIAVFVGGLIALNRLQQDNELVVCQAGGMSRRIACMTSRPPMTSSSSMLSRLCESEPDIETSGRMSCRSGSSGDLKIEIGRAHV